MATPAGLRYRPIRILSAVIAIAGTLSGLLLAAFSLYRLLTITDKQAGGNDGMVLGVGLILATLSLTAYALLEILMKAAEAAEGLHSMVSDLIIITRRIDPLIKTISHNSQMSDAAKSITNRTVEREALRHAIQEELYSDDVEAAQSLINDLERRFGYQQEAQKLRQEMTKMRELTIGEKINEAISHIEKLMADHHWPRAEQEIERLTRLFPRHERAAALPAELQQLRQQHKQDLLAQWKTAVQREEVDRGIAILTELDQYLTKEEAETLQDEARHVFKARLVNLGVRFGLAASEGRWRDAFEIGLHIRQEFPNSRMAHEVSEKLDALRTKAGFVTDVDDIELRSAPKDENPKT